MEKVPGEAEFQITHRGFEVLAGFGELGLEVRIDAGGGHSVELLLKRCAVLAVAAFGEQLAHTFGESACVGDNGKGIAFIDFARGEAGELLAVEFPAAHGPLFIDGAAETLQRGAGLLHPEVLATMSHAQAEGAELGGGVLRLHAHDLEEGAVTAKATGQAQSRGCGGGFGGHGCTGGMHFVFGKRQRGRERTLMKLSNLPMLIVAVLLAGMVWIFFDMSRPMPASHGAAAGTVASAIAQSTAAKPVMVEFYADWCGPCKEIGPQVEEFAREVASRARVIRVNVDEDPKLGYDLGVRVIPTFVVFKNGKESARETGAIPKSRMRELLAQ